MITKAEALITAANTGNSSVLWLSPKRDDTDCANKRGSAGVIAYATHNLIAIVDIIRCGNDGCGEEIWREDVVCTLRGHSGTVTALSSFVKAFDIDNPGPVEIISGSRDETVKVWRCQKFPADLSVWNCSFTLTGLRSPVVALSTVHIACLGSLIAASDSTGRIVVWRRGVQQEQEELSPSSLFQEVEVLDSKPAVMPNCLHLCCIPTGSQPSNTTSALPSFVALIIGGVDSRVHVRIATFLPSDPKSHTTAAMNDKLAMKDDGVKDNSFTSSSLALSPKFALLGYLVGHDEWVTCIDSIAVDESTVLIATGSQDSKIRIWRFSYSPPALVWSSPSSSSAVSGSLNDAAEVVVIDAVVSNPALGDNIEDEGDDLEANEDDVKLSPDEITTEARLVFGFGKGTGRLSGGKVNVYFDALLFGHEDWVTSVSWMARSDNASSLQEGEQVNKLRLFSTSIDRNMIIWQEEKDGAAWTPSSRIGDVGGMLGGSVGANLLGFTSGCVRQTSSCNEGDAVCGIGYGGSFHVWRTGSRGSGSSENESEKRWFSQPFLTGHFGPVKDICWASDGSYLLSVSSDQTCRVFAPISNAKSSIARGLVTNSPMWREVSRPQIHGYDLNGIAAECSPSYKIYSASDEKVVRVFDVPGIFLSGLEKLCAIPPHSNSHSASPPARVMRAYIPELGLSNRPSELMTHQEALELQSRNVQAIDWRDPPLESQLADHTVWPEVKKLFGHSNSVVTIVLSHSCSLLATACKARNSETAEILIRDTETSQIVQALQGHESTVLCMCFSCDDTLLASSGKDRSLCIFQKASGSNQNETFSLLAATRNAHKRIVWDCAFSPDGKIIVTASRDGLVKLWVVCKCKSGDGQNETSKSSLICVHSFTPFDGNAVTSVHTTPSDRQDVNSFLVAVGGEDGRIKVFEVTTEISDRMEGSNCLCSCIHKSTELATIDEPFLHSGTVVRLRWRPAAHNAPSSQSVKYLASCGEDHSVRIFKVLLTPHI